MKRIRILSFILSFVLIVSICGCMKQNDVSNEKSAPTLVKKDGQYYIQFDGKTKSDKGLYESSVAQDYVYFSSMDEFYSEVTNLDFSEEELKKISGFRSDDNGIRVCDVDNLYQPIVPDGNNVESIAWSGDEYMTIWSSEKVDQGMFFVLDTYDEFTSVVDSLSWGDDYFKQENVKVLDYSEIQTDNYEMVSRIFTTFSESGQSKLKIECYESILDDVTYKVIVNYRIETDVDFGYEVHTSDVVPYRVCVFGNSGDVYWYQLITDMKDEVSADWLMSFGIEPYVAK